MVVLHAQGARQVVTVTTGEGAVQVLGATVDVLREGLVSLGHRAEVVGTLHAVGLGFGLGESGQQHAGEDADNGDHHQQLNQSECFFVHFC